MPAIPTDQSQLDAIVDGIEPAAQDVTDKIDECRAKVDSVHEPSGWERAGQALLTAVFPIAGLYFSWKELERILMSQPEVRVKLQEAADGVATVMEEVTKLASPGNPFIMKMMADNWDTVNTILTGAQAALADDKFFATKSWTDDMGQRYANVPAGQKAALDGMVPHVANMQTFLRDHSTEIIRYWWELGEIVAQFVIDALPLAAKFITGNPIKWLELAEPIAEAIAHILQLVKDLASRLFNFAMTSNGQIETFRANASNVEGTDFGSWPVARIG